MTQQVREGWRYVVGHRLMQPMMTDAAATDVAVSMLLTQTPLYVVRELGASPRPMASCWPAKDSAHWWEHPSSHGSDAGSAPAGC